MALLNEDSITQAMEGIIKSIREGNPKNAQETLDNLDFEGLPKAIADPSKGADRRLFVVPAHPFGTERVDETGNRLRECGDALGRGDGKGALDSAQKALKRWQEG